MKLALASILGLLTASCASIATGASDAVDLSSSPSASFTTSSGLAGTTPATISIPDNEDVTVRFELEGYEPAEVVLRSRASAWLLGNVLLGGVPIILDAAMGNFWTHTAEAHVELVPIQG